MSFVDREIVRWATTLGFRVEHIKNAPEFHIALIPKTPGLVVEVGRPADGVYVMGAAIAVDQRHREMLLSMKPEERRRFLHDLKMWLLVAGVDFSFSPVDAEVPEVIFVSRVMPTEALDFRHFVDTYYRVRNAGMMVILHFAELLHTKQATTPLYA